MNNGFESSIRAGKARSRIDIESELLKRVHCMQVARQMVGRVDRPLEKSFVQISIADTGESPRRQYSGRAFPEASKACAKYMQSPEDRTSIVMAKRFTEALQGRLDVDTHPDAGTVVTMLLPCLSERKGHLGSPSDRPKPPSRWRGAPPFEDMMPGHLARSRPGRNAARTMWDRRRGFVRSHIYFRAKEKGRPAGSVETAP
jgi:hypothetical protein